MSPRLGEKPIGYRRNGKKQACEPCRKGKLACDHGSPFCGRCVRRKTTERCIYHPAPMTKIKSPINYSNIQRALESTSLEPAAGLSRASEPANNVSSQIPLPNSGSGTGSQAYEGSIRIGTEPHSRSPDKNVSFPTLSTRKNEDSWKSAVFPRSSKYYGPTSFSAVFVEHKAKDSAELLDIGEDARKHPGSWPFGQPLLGRERPSAPTMRMKEVIKAVWNIPSKEICDQLLDMSGSIHDLTLNPILIRHCVKTLWENFEHLLVAPRSAELLTAFAEVLFKNEESLLPPTPEDGFDWLNTFMGPNLRFETLGVLFCYFGKAYICMQDWDPLFKIPENHGRNRKETAWRMKECADICRKMCHYSETINEVVVVLSYNIHVLESFCSGDESYLMRYRHGDTVTSTIMAGLHRLPDYANTKVTTASEYKRRIFSVVYFVDKTASSLHGTPPMLGRLYCDVKPCFDLSDEELFQPQHALAVAISRLDSYGWNSAGSLFKVTVSRGLWRVCAIREEILELALGINVLVSEERLEELRLRCHHVYEGLPEQLSYISDETLPRDSVGKTLFPRAMIMLEFLQNKFLIDRVAVARGFPNETLLLNTSMEILSTSTMFWMMRDQLIPFTGYFDWIITYFGVPSAGVICIELLKSQSDSQNHVGFSRSDAIQKLTLFIGFLEWIRPTDGNYKLAGRLRKVVRRVLDHVLDNRHTEATGTNSMDETAFDPTMLAPLDNLNDMDWLNTIDWTQGSWMDFN